MDTRRRLLKDKLGNPTRGLLVALAALGLGIAGCSSTTPTDSPDTIRIGIKLSGMSGSYDPAAMSMSGPQDTHAVYESLFESTSAIEAGGFEPMLGTGYELSDDWKTLTLYLQDGVTFTDGEKFTADALKTYLDGMAANEDWWFQFFWDLNSPTLTVIDDTTLEFSSEKPMPLHFRRFIHMLFTQVPIASPSVLEDLEAAKTTPVGSGPYVIDSLTPEVGFTLSRNEEYWDPESYPFDKMEFTVFEDEIAAHNALKSGQIDAASLTVGLAQESESQGLTLNIKTIGGTTELLYVADRNGTVTPALADQRVRQAMALAFDRPAIHTALNKDYGPITSQPFVEGTPEYVEGGDDRYGYDPERAKELLAEAGYADGFDLSILSIAGSNFPEPLIVQYLGDIGIRVTVDTKEAADFFDAAINGTSYSVIAYGIDFPNVLPVFISPDATFNPFKIADPVVDGYWEQIQNGPDEASEEALDGLGEYVVDQSILIVYKTTPAIWVTAPGFVAPFKLFGPLLRDFSYTG
jgi:peptide/nickel transport system substrate-binding protein